MTKKTLLGVAMGLLVMATSQSRTVRVPHLFEVDLSGDKLVVGKQIQD